MEERRQFVRLDTRLDITYAVLPSGQAQQTVVKNVSGSGVCIFLKQAVPQGSRLQVAMKLPGREQPVNFTAEVVWCERYEMIGQTERQQAVEAGVRFVEISPADREAILQHVILQLQPNRPKP